MFKHTETCAVERQAKAFSPAWSVAVSSPLCWGFMDVARVEKKPRGKENRVLSRRNQDLLGFNLQPIAFTVKSLLLQNRFPEFSFPSKGSVVLLLTSWNWVLHSGDREVLCWILPGWLKTGQTSAALLHCFPGASKMDESKNPRTFFHTPVKNDS